MRFEDRTPGDLLGEYFEQCVAELAELRSKGSLDPHETDRVATLERMLILPDEKTAAAVAWESENCTGDPLVDYWEYCATHGLPVDLDLTEPPEDWMNGKR